MSKIVKHPALKPIKGGKDSADWRGTIMEHARIIADGSEKKSELVGFYMVGLYSDGRVSTGFRWDPERTRIPRRLMPAYVAELVREDMLTIPAAGEEACAIFNQGPE